MHQRVPVHLGCGRQQEPRSLQLREAERVVRPVRPDLQRVQRQPRVVDRARRRRHVVDEVDPLVDLVVACDVEMLEPEVVALQVLDVVERAGVEVVDADDPVAAVEQVVAEVGAKKARAAGHQTGRHRA